MVSLIDPKMLKSVTPQIEKYVMFNGTDIGKTFFKMVCLLLIIVLFCRYDGKND
jgi:hypothetical protein